MRIPTKIPLIMIVTIFAAWLSARIFFAFDFYYNCESYLVSAAHANSVKTAKQELTKALTYLKNHNLTNGQIPIFIVNPSGNIGLWYEKLNNSMIELPSEASIDQDKNTVALSNLKNTILHRSIFGIKVIHPSGISIYPHNILFFIWGLFSFIGSIYWGILYFTQYQIDVFFNEYL
jgi:hypothetical protein